MPDFAQPPGWEGECTFAAPGTYAFVCGDAPVEMTGTVIVDGGDRADADAHAHRDADGHAHGHADRGPDGRARPAGHPRQGPHQPDGQELVPGRREQ